MAQITSDTLARIALLVEEAGGVVGHVKASVQTTETDTISITEASQTPSVRKSEIVDVTINAACIVFAITEDTAREIAEIIKHII